MPDTAILDAARDELARTKRLADKAIAQIGDDVLYVRPDPAGNSVATLMRHMAGNMRSRWIGFLTTDGEKPDRARDQEFEDVARSRAELIAEWDAGWQCVFDALEPLTDADLARVVTIRAEPHSVIQALTRQIAHYAGHTYQIVQLARQLAGPGWTTLSIPRGQSEAFNRQMLAQAKIDK